MILGSKEGNLKKTYVEDAGFSRYMNDRTKKKLNYFQLTQVMGLDKPQVTGEHKKRKELQRF